MGLFTSGVMGDAEALEDVTTSALSTSGLEMTDLFTFGQVNLQLVDILVTSVIIVITGANAFAPKAASGGHNYKVLFHLSITMVVAGALMLVVPRSASSMFHKILSGTP